LENDPCICVPGNVQGTRSFALLEHPAPQRLIKGSSLLRCTPHLYLGWSPQLTILLASCAQDLLCEGSPRLWSIPFGKMGLERGMQAVVTAAVFNGLAFIFIVLRCISRFWILHHGGPEDYLIIFALLLSVATTVTIALRMFPTSFTWTESIAANSPVEKNNGLGRHSDTVSLEENQNLSKVSVSRPKLYQQSVTSNSSYMPASSSTTWVCSSSKTPSSTNT
jgi:hypothetical protein